MLKFHFRSDKRVVLLAIFVVVVVENDVNRCDRQLLAGGAKAVVDVETKTITAIVASSMRLDKFWIVIMMYFLQDSTGLYG
jgi:hypothetical protein